ncbi:MAG: DUF2157 domain-containing protein [Bacteroidia bacterium]
MLHEKQLAEQLLQEEVLSEREFHQIDQHLSTQKISLHWELRMLLYIGITLFTSGLGVFIYKNIGSVGHLLLVLLMFAGCAGSYYYAFKKALAFNKEAVQHSNPFYDYIVLLASLLFVSALGYLQYQFNVFGTYISLPTLFSSLVLFYTAFRFDHKGVLTLAISLHAAYWGLIVSPTELVNNPEMFAGGERYVWVSIGVAALFYGYAWVCRGYKVKIHFVPVLLHFSINIMLIALVTAVFTLPFKGLYFVLLLLISVFWFMESRRERSFALFISLVFANYIALSYFILKAVFDWVDGDSITVALLYLMGSTVGIIYILRNHKKFTGHDVQ